MIADDGRRKTKKGGISLMNFCPFYGRELVDHPGVHPVLKPTEGYQCALITHAYGPCYMDVDGIEPEWDACGRNPVVNGTYEYGIEEARRRMALIQASEDREK
jgi:hypothetical protein